ncbi:MAG: transcription antitermination factor NusB [Eggerthellaceae bacterium]|nr:transcription antitermination factor NusB [Eggerthellaceae bacterium]
MTAVRVDRNKGRRTAVQLLYASELTDETPVAIAEAGAAPEEVELTEYALKLLDGVQANLSEIDGMLDGASENWAVSRMPIVDKCILRVAVFEMLKVPEVPVSVTINEAVELAKDFGGEDESHRFVNGVLGKIAAQLENPAPAAEAGEQE